MKKRIPSEEKVKRLNLADTTGEAVARLEQEEALREEKIWSYETHPDLTSQDDINRYLREMRTSFGLPVTGID